MTSTGVLMMPLGLLLILQPWPILLSALPVFALFHGAAVINVGTVGLQPGYFLAILIIGRTVLELTVAQQPLNRLVLARVAPLAVLLVVSMMVLWIAVVTFDGRVMVLSGSAKYNLDLVEPFSLRRENLAQILYLLLNVLLVFSVAHQTARLSAEEALRAIDIGMVVAILVSALICAWQIYSFYMGAYFAEDFFASNAGYAKSGSQVFFGYLRVNGPFSEPSALAYFYSGFLFYAWLRHRERPSPRSLALVVISAGALALAFSTTAMIALLLFALLAMAEAAIRLRRVRFRAWLTWQGLLSGLVLLFPVALAVALVVTHWSGMSAIIDIALLSKSETSSFEVRGAADLLAFDILATTYGLGIGLGSHKPNSLALTLISNVGVLGTAIFVGFVGELLCARRPATRSRGERGWLDDMPLRAFVAALLVGHALSNPNLNFVILWIGFGFVIGCLAQTQPASGWAATRRHSPTGSTSGTDGPGVREER